MPRSEYRNLSNNDFFWKFRLLVGNIEKYLGEPHNPDDMLVEGQALLEELHDTQHKADSFDMLDATRIDNIEDNAFEALVAALKRAKKFVDYFAGKEYFGTLDIPSRMPRSRDKVPEAARAVLSAWDEHSADPELAGAVPAMEALRVGYDKWVAAWDAQEDANRIKKEKYRSAREARAKCEKFVSRVKKYLSLHLEPDDSKWGLYGFERRGEE